MYVQTRRVTQEPMFAISFDMSVTELQQHYGTPYHGAYYEIKRVLVRHGFYWIQGSTYMTDTDDMGRLFAAIEALKQMDWFRKSVRDLRGYKVENWSDFTSLVREH